MNKETEADLFFKNLIYDKYKDKKSLKYYEQIIEDYETGILCLDDKGLIEIANDIIGFDDDNWYECLSDKYKRGCNNIKTELACDICHKFDTYECEYTHTISLAAYIYRNLVINKSEITILSAFLEGQLEDM